MADSRTEYAVRWPYGDVERRSEDLARRSVAWHADGANRSAWRGRVTLMRRTVTYSDWEEVADE